MSSSAYLEVVALLYWESMMVGILPYLHSKKASKRQNS